MRVHDHAHLARQSALGLLSLAQRLVRLRPRAEATAGAGARAGAGVRARVGARAMVRVRVGARVRLRVGVRIRGALSASRWLG